MSSHAQRLSGLSPRGGHYAGHGDCLGRRDGYRGDGSVEIDTAASKAISKGVRPQENI